ncbi:hypothetical protein LNQ81_10950 [Myroides sp. M-43]|uniref:hypothetical protein n=1 Tax=Myroides oncorhynchi TaxID=2893756 RepID=UPI001E467D0B|nr:hypothetical protein [Myroides oncorhynchi]MCC9043191.1 hypothetical protein [Myroides oncorhynchi]
MKKYMNYKCFIRGVLILFLTLFVHSNNVFAQIPQTAKGTQISDNTAPHTLDPLAFSLLELNSTERGFLMPRMTTAERSNIPTSKLIAGLTIYNTTMGCVEFYNVTRQIWMNLCGDVEPAIFTIPTEKCNTIKISGDYIQGMLLDVRKNIITLEVNVSSPGTFDIEAIAYDNTTGTENGYVFEAKGVFPNSGNFLLVLKGQGTPKKGYANVNTKDKITFVLNKKLSTCFVYNHVKPDFEPLVIAFDCSNPIKTEGVYKEKIALNNGNRIIVPFKVTKAGRAKVYGEIPVSGSQTEVIKYESNQIDFRPTLPGEVQEVILSPSFDTGKPTTGGTLNGKLKLVSNGKHDYDPFVDPIEQIVDGCNFSIEVASDGPKYSIGAIKLESKFTSQLDTKDKNGASVTYGTPYITPKTNMGTNGTTDFQAVVTISPKAAGQYVIKSEKINGVWFEGTGTISDADVRAGIKTIRLRAYGKSDVDLPLVLGRFDFTGNNLDPALSNTGTMFVDFVYRPMNMYSIGGGSDQSWHPGGNNLNATWSAGPRTVRQYRHFSWDGVVRIANLNILDIDVFDAKVTGLNTSVHMSSTSAINVSTFKDNLKKADMVFVGGYGGSNLTKRPQQLSDLALYVGVEKGALVYGEGDVATMQSFFSNLGLSGTVSNNTATGAVYRVESNSQVQSRLIIGVFNKYFSSGDALGGLAGLSLGGHGNNTQITFNMSTSDVVPIAGNNGSFAFVHKNLGFVGVASSVFMGGFYNDGGGNNYYPLSATTDGTPLKRNLDGKGAYSYNSWFLLNLVHWAIDYAQTNQPNEIKPK